MEQNNLASLLLNVRGLSITSSAKSCGFNASAVAGWLKGVPGRLSQEKQNIFLESLGVSGGTLSPHIVHVWTVNQKLDPLREILVWSGGEFESAYPIPQNVRLKDWAPTRNLGFFFDLMKPIRILLRQKISPLIFPLPSSNLTPKNLPIKYMDVPKGYGFVDKIVPGPLIRIPENLYDKFMSDNPDVSIEEFDQVLNLTNKKRSETRVEGRVQTWKEFISWAEGKGINPKEAQKRLEEQH